MFGTNLFFTGISPIAIIIITTYLIIMIFPGIFNKNNDINNYILEGYFKEEKSEDKNRVRGHLDFYKYYYNTEDDKKFINSTHYNKVNTNIDKIKNYIKDTQDVLSNRKNINFFDLTINEVDDNDYFYLYEKDKPNDIPTSSTYYLYYYDIQKHILYVANIVD